MTRRLPVLVLLVCLPSLAGDADPRLHFPAHGFSIAPLEDRSADANVLVLTMALPPLHGFQPNVNVIAQPCKGTLDEFAALSRAQIASNGWRLVRDEKQGEEGLRIEYNGTFDGRPLHWYAVSIKRGDHVYVVTATAPEEHWPRFAAKLQACVDSFRLDPEPEPR